MDKRFENVDKQFGKVGGTLAAICDRLGWIEGALNKHRNPARDAATAG